MTGISENGGASEISFVTKKKKIDEEKGAKGRVGFSPRGRTSAERDNN